MDRVAIIAPARTAPSKSVASTAESWKDDDVRSARRKFAHFTLLNTQEGRTDGSADTHGLDLALPVAGVDPDRVEAPVRRGGQGDVVGAIAPGSERRVGPRRRDVQGGRIRRAPVGGGCEVKVPGVLAPGPF